MSVLLNITMPKTCEVCPCNDDNWRCGATKEYFDYDDMCERRRADCPLIEIPTPHGRLIDADATCNDLAAVDPRYETMIDWCIRVIEAQRTVIEAEKE